MTTVSCIPVALHPDVNAIKAAILEAAAKPIEQAVTLPPAAYQSDAFFDLEREAVLKAGWLALGHVSQLPEAGSYFAVDLSSEPLVVVRGEDERVRVLSRVCPHRGADILHSCLGTPRSGTSKRLACPYHMWTFDLDGAVKGAPQMQQAENFRKEDWRLGEFRSEVWEGFIFVNLNGAAPPLAELYGDLGERIAPWRCAEMTLIAEQAWQGDFDWKVMAENWSECYHHLGAHSKTLQPAWPGQDVVIADEHPHFMQTNLVYGDAAMKAIAAGESYLVFPRLPDLPLDARTDFWIFLGYPCFLLATLADCVLWLRVLPESAGRCSILTTILVPVATAARPDIEVLKARMEAVFYEFHREDMRINVAVQEGLKSSRAVVGRLSHLESPIWMFQRYLARALEAAG